MIVRPRRQFTSAGRAPRTQSLSSPEQLQSASATAVDAVAVVDPHGLQIEDTPALDEARARYAAAADGGHDDAGPVADSSSVDGVDVGGDGEDNTSVDDVAIADTTEITGVAVPPEELTEQQIDEMKRPELVQQLKSRGLNAGGTKVDMVERLKAALSREA